VTIVEQRDRIGTLTLANPGLKLRRDDLFESAYRAARRFASAETGLSMNLFPEDPLTREQAEDDGFLPP
jgi:ribosomal protein L16/L10AE